MPKTRREIAREVNEILAGNPRYQPPVDNRGEVAFRNIQQEARAAEYAVDFANNASAVAAQQSPGAAHSLVASSQEHANQARKLIEKAYVWVHEAQGTSQLSAVERVLASIQRAAARAKSLATATQRAYEKRYGKYDPRGVTAQNMQRGK